MPQPQLPDLPGRPGDEGRLRAVVDNSPIVLVAFDATGTITLAEGWDLTTFGLLGSGLVGLGLGELRDRVPSGGAAVERALAGKACEVMLTLRGRHFDFRCRPQFDSAGKVAGVLAVGNDVTERVEAGERSSQREARWQSLVSQSADVAVIVDPDTARITYVSPAVTRLFGWQPEQLLGRRVRTLVHPDDVDRLQTSFAIVAADSASHPTVEFRLACADGSYRWVEETMSNLAAVPGVNGLVANIRDITARRTAETALRASDTRYRLIAETAQEGIWACAHDGRTLFANQKLAELLGWSLSDIYALPSHNLLSGMSREDIVERHRNRAADGIEIFEQQQIRPDGSRRILRFSAGALTEDGSRLGALAMITDVTDARAAEQELRTRAFHDPLTGLANRALLIDRLDAALASTGPGEVAVLVADLDHFKLVNDSFGHAAGDELLTEVARRWQQVLRPGDTLARLGGDEFVVVCARPGESAARAIAADLLQALELPVILADRSVAVSASIGIALSGSAAARRVDATALLREGDAAMYAAKSEGRGLRRMFTRRLADQARSRLELSYDLKCALEANELKVAYQPVVELATGRMLGVEALCRWTHLQRGVVSPGEFIAVAEETGLIEPLDNWVLRRACRDAVAMRASGLLAPDAYVAVNVSAGQLSKPGFEASVQDALTATGLPAGALVLEITESAIMPQPAEARQVLESLSRLGVDVAIDDFGTGYSSLAYLRRLPVSTLKIDRSFTQQLAESPDDRAIVRAVIDLAHALDVGTTAEGIESVAALRLLQQFGCRAGQGFLWSQAVSPAQLAELVRPLPGGRFVVGRQGGTARPPRPRGTLGEAAPSRKTT